MATFNLTMRFFSLPSCQKISINKIAASIEIFQIFKFPECARIENINKNSFMLKWKVKKHFDFQPFSLMECMMAREPIDLPIPTVYPVNAESRVAKSNLHLRCVNRIPVLRVF